MVPHLDGAPPGLPMRFVNWSGDLKCPAIDAFLSAVDLVMNSNTLLLKFVTNVDFSVDNQQQVLHTFLRSHAFEEMMLAVEHDRGWSNLASCFDEEDEAKRPLVQEGFRATIAPLSHDQLLDRLRWMLCDAFSPYRQQLSPGEAEPLVQDFAREALVGVDPSWSYGAVEPDFLRSTCYYSDEDPVDPAYFDGSESDTATFMHWGRLCYLLLTNGCP